MFPSSVIGYDFGSTFCNVAALLTLYFAFYTANRLNTVAAWILLAVSVIIFQPLAFWLGLSWAWSIAYLLLDIVALCWVIDASIRSCKNGNSCCTTNGFKKCKTGGKSSGCFSDCCSGCDCDCMSDCCSNDDCDDGDRHHNNPPKHHHAPNPRC